MRVLIIGGDVGGLKTVEAMARSPVTMVLEDLKSTTALPVRYARKAHRGA